MVHWQLFSLGELLLNTRMAFGTVRRIVQSPTLDVHTQWTQHVHIRRKCQHVMKCGVKKSLSSSLSSGLNAMRHQRTECHLHLFTYILRLRRSNETTRRIKSSAQHAAVIIIINDRHQRNVKGRATVKWRYKRRKEQLPSITTSTKRNASVKVCCDLASSWHTETWSGARQSETQMWGNGKSLTQSHTFTWKRWPHRQHR